MSVSVEEVLGTAHLTSNLGVTTAAGTLSTDYLLALIGKDFEDDTNTGPPTTGTWAEVEFATAGVDNAKIRAWIRQAGTSGAITVSFTNAADDAAAHMHVFRLRGVDLTTPVGDSNSNTGDMTSASFVAPSVTAPDLGLLICAWLDSGADNVITSIAVPAGMTAGPLTGVSSNWSNMRSGYQIISAAGATGTKTATANDTEPGDLYAALSIAIKQSGGGGGGGNKGKEFMPFFI